MEGNNRLTPVGLGADISSLLTERRQGVRSTLILNEPLKRTTPIKSFLRLIKYKVSATVAFTTIPGYLLVYSRIDLNIIWILAAVYLLASAATALNQIQERRYDALMIRTFSRPIPQKEISVKVALLISGLLLLMGSIILLLKGGIIPCLLGVFNIIWYNGLYTYLKRITAFAVVPGSLIGAVPPLIGWTAAGGSVFSAQPWILGFFLFLWQIPHFWLLMIRFDADYRRAGYPVMSDVFTSRQLKKITAVWIIASIVSFWLFPLFGILHSAWSVIAISMIGLSLIIWILWALLTQNEIHLKPLTFVMINLGMIISMILIIFDNV